MLVRSGEFNDSARLLVMRSTCIARRGILCWEEYEVGALIGIENGFDVLGLVSSGADGKPNGDSWADAGESVSVADWGGVNVNPPKAGLMPVGDM